MDVQALTTQMVREILEGDEDGAVESMAVLFGWAAKGGFPPHFRKAYQDANDAFVNAGGR